MAGLVEGLQQLEIAPLVLGVDVVSGQTPVNLSVDCGQLVNVFGVGSHRLSALLAIEPMKNAKETMAKGIDISASGDHAINDAERRITPQSV
jgi:tetrahydromethanopterin S-methyltransferase subunit D